MTGLDPVIFLMRNTSGRGMHNQNEYSELRKLKRPMKPRITINTTKDGEIEIWLNPAGRDVLVRELLALNEKSEHFHFNPEEIELSRQSYRPDDTIYEYGKVYFRTEEWDKKYFPHVFMSES